MIFRASEDVWDDSLFILLSIERHSSINTNITKKPRVDISLILADKPTCAGYSGYDSVV